MLRSVRYTWDILFGITMRSLTPYNRGFFCLYYQQNQIHTFPQLMAHHPYSIIPILSTKHPHHRVLSCLWQLHFTIEITDWCLYTPVFTCWASDVGPIVDGIPKHEELYQWGHNDPILHTCFKSHWLTPHRSWLLQHREVTHPNKGHAQNLGPPTKGVD